MALAEKMTPGECEQARQEGVERMGFLNKGNCKCQRLRGEREQNTCGNQSSWDSPYGKEIDSMCRGSNESPIWGTTRSL